MTHDLLLVNPHVHDFAAFDFWARPLGLLTLGGMLRQLQVRLSLLDCMDPLSPWLPSDQRPRRGALGCGRFLRTPIPAPAVLPSIDRRFCRYGLSPEHTRRALDDLPRPDLILVTSMMTYWYTGVSETIALLKERWPDAPVVLGGIYATLCPDHARARSGADHLAPGPASEALPLVAGLLGMPAPSADPERCLPAHALAPHADSAALMTSIGCPHRCTYCGVRVLSGAYRPLTPGRVVREARHLVLDLGIRHLAIYDDAFLADPDRAVEILELLAAIDGPTTLHAASGLSCRGLTREVARAMRRAGLRTVRLGLETSDAEAQRRFGGKVTTAELEAALENLSAAGYDRSEVGVYVLLGLPGQGRDEVERSVAQVLRLGARPHLAEYSPVPGSPLFEEARAASALDLDEPLLHNPTLLPCAGADLDRAAVAMIKQDLRRTT